MAYNGHESNQRLILQFIFQLLTLPPTGHDCRVDLQFTCHINLQFVCHVNLQFVSHINLQFICHIHSQLIKHPPKCHLKPVWPTTDSHNSCSCPTILLTRLLIPSLSSYPSVQLICWIYFNVMALYVSDTISVFGLAVT